MRTTDICDDDGQLAGFHVSNSIVGRRGICRLIEAIPGARVTRHASPMFSWDSDDEFCEFEIDGILFSVWEPYGDSDAYWVGAKNGGAVPQIATVRAAFARANPWRYAIHLF